MSTALFTPNLGLAAAAVGLGAALGAVARWQLSTWLNPLQQDIPLGTLACNLIGGYLVGVAMAWLAQNPELSPAWRLFIVTGFLGGLTTFSTFSAEVVGLLQQDRLGMAATVVALHLGGSLAGTLAGLATISALKA